MRYEGRNDRDWINEEDWKKAKGVIVHKNETNPGLAKRDYSVPCHTRYCIVVIQGYWVWWCSTHHQPHFICEREIWRNEWQ